MLLLQVHKKQEKINERNEDIYIKKGKKRERTRKKKGKNKLECSFSTFFSHRLVLAVFSVSLELHAVGSITGLDGEDGAEVTGEDLTVLVLLDGGDDGGVDLLLEGDTFIRDLLLAGGCGLSFLATEESSGGLGLLFSLGAGEGLLVNLVEDLSVSEVDLGGGGDDVTAVDTAEGDTVVLVGTGDDEGLLVSGIDVLEDDAVAATEATGEHDGDGAGLDGGGLASGFGTLLGSVLGGLLSGSHFVVEEKSLRKNKRRKVFCVVEIFVWIGNPWICFMMVVKLIFKKYYELYKQMKFENMKTFINQNSFHPFFFFFFLEHFQKKEQSFSLVDFV